jgi:hypothetical protein
VATSWRVWERSELQAAQYPFGFSRECLVGVLAAQCLDRRIDSFEQLIA